MSTVEIFQVVSGCIMSAAIAVMCVHQIITSRRMLRRSDERDAELARMAKEEFARLRPKSANDSPPTAPKGN